MHQRTTSGNLTSSPTWEGLHEWLRNAIQALIQEALEAEVTELLGRVRYQRRAAVDAPAGYRNGYGKPRKLTTPMGTLTLRRPRVRGLEERFESRILPRFVRRTKEVSELLPELDLHGLAEGDFDLALRGLLGEEAPLSARTVARLKERWQAEWEAWRTRRLDELQVVYLWVDGVYVKAGLERERAALLVAVAGLVDGRKEVVAVVPGYRESVASWSEVLRDLRDRGMNAPRLVIGDGHLGIWGALRNVWPEAEEQRCWNHKVLNVLEQLPRRQQAVAKPMLRAIAYAPTRAEAERKRKAFEAWCHRHGDGKAAETLGRDWERMVTFYRYPKEHWRHLRTTNVVESPFAALRLRTDAAKRFKKVERATAVIWKMLMVAQRRFRRLSAPELLAKVYAGARYEDGIEVAEKGVAA
ncbi:IS256 family transposase [Thermaerobacter composti]|uniref:Mutator family transposase n=1 Tax=Thermaerobacter composti TaxID=554949 RepID=A0ABZ0QM12_9FIRM|nr:IS256 family transposase [Thermaerobacter composti]WPD18456.1 IS256 family transposase [Thermaerobacter composti]